MGFTRKEAMLIFGGERGAGAAFSRVSAAGGRGGIRFVFRRVASAPNTLDAHSLIEVFGEALDLVQSGAAG